MMLLSQIATLLNDETLIGNYKGVEINYLAIDSRQIIDADNTLFFALHTDARDGHAFINDAYNKGVRFFVATHIPNFFVADDAIFIIVNNVQTALQNLAAYYRSLFTIPIIGITGSNGKTIVKEWLNTICKPQFNIAKSPQSFNSQIGVALSIWQLNKHSQLGIFEAGISTINEMEKLQAIIKPTIGVFTHLGTAHIEGFKNKTELLRQKWLLFKDCEVIICEALEEYEAADFINKKHLVTWGETGNFLKVVNMHKHAKQTEVVVQCLGQVYHFTIPFTEAILITNAMHVITTAMYLKLDKAILQHGLQALSALPMRLSITDGINNCKIINDAYTNDIEAIRAAIAVMHQYKEHKTNTLIISDVDQQSESLYQAIFNIIESSGINNLITIGTQWFSFLHGNKNLKIAWAHFNSTQLFLQGFVANNFVNQTILIKGARKFEFEKIADLLQLKTHETWVTINLQNLTENLNSLRKCLPKNMAIMAMVKASSYGSGVLEIAAHLAQNNINYLAVAYADEGVLLRQKGIQLPIMVMNPEPNQWQKYLDYKLEAEIYSFLLLQNIIQFAKVNDAAQLSVHIKIDTGMHRLGFLPNEVDELLILMQQHNFLKIKSVFTHLAAADDAAHDDFTYRQISIFNTMVEKIKGHITYPFFTHIANSATVIRFGAAQCNMVRLGIGMYGINPTSNTSISLQPVLSFYTTIAQIKNIEAGQSIGYGLSYITNKPSIIATVRVGYADGFPRCLSNGVGYMMINNAKAYVVGKVCMDMVMLDITDIPHVQVGSIVTIIGHGITASDLASMANTIPYEIITGISNRVHRLYEQ